MENKDMFYMIAITILFVVVISNYVETNAQISKLQEQMAEQNVNLKTEIHTQEFKLFEHEQDDNLVLQKLGYYKVYDRNNTLIELISTDYQVVK
jgi:hypothetical protein